MRVLFCVMIAIAVFLSLSCGRSSDLGSVGGFPVTTEEYLTVFNNLPADMQVSVLEPGGRLELMNRIVMKKALLAAWEEDRTVSDGWEDLYRISMLSDSMFNRIGHGFDQQGYIDSLLSCGFSDFSLRVVLLDDSATASEMAFEWNEGNFDASVASLSAPWSLPNGSSYRIFSGSVQSITTSFTPLLAMDTEIAHVLPMYGEWCVCILGLKEGECIPEESASSQGFFSALAEASPHITLSKGISSLAGECMVNGEYIVPSIDNADENREPVVVFNTDTLTVADIIKIMEMADSANFPGEIPSEIAAFSPPRLNSSPEITLWLYVESIAQRYALADLAVENGISLPENALDYARAESVIRAAVLEKSIPDSAGVARWFDENSEIFLLPERRSVLLGYTEASPDTQTVSGFSDLTGCQSFIDQSGAMIPTPLQVESAFGDQLGPVIFAADSGVFSGPVSIDVELVAWFEVVEIVSPEIAPLEDVYPHAELMAASMMFNSEFESFMSDLFVTYSVTIDTAAVSNIDLWGGTQ